MGCSKFISGTQTEILKSNDVINPNTLKVQDSFAFRAANNKVQRQLKTTYDVDIPNPLGTEVNGVFKPATKADAVERDLKERGMKRYDGVNANGFDIGDGTMIVFDPTTVADISIYDLDTIPARRIDESGNEIPMDLTIRGIYNSTTKPGVRNFIDDIAEYKNTPLLNAAVPSLMVPLNARLDKARRYETSFVRQEKHSDRRSIMERNLKSNSTQQMEESNKMFDEVLSKTGTLFSINFGREGEARIGGSASANHVNMNLMAPMLGATSVASANYNMAITYLHEKAHIVTLGLIKNDKEFDRRTQELYEYTKKALGKSNLYGMKNRKEFLAEALANPEFQNKLETISAEDQSIWKHIINSISDAISKLLGTYSGPYVGSVLDSVLDLTQVAANKAAANNVQLTSMTTDNFHVFDNINDQGVYEGNAEIVDIEKWAEDSGVAYDPNTKRFSTFDDARIPLNKAEIATKIDWQKNEFYWLTEVADYSSFEDYMNARSKEGVENDETPFLNYKEEEPVKMDTLLPSNVNGDIDRLKAVDRVMVTKPDDAKEDAEGRRMYQVNTASYFRATSYLGFGSPKPSILLKNAGAIGNVVDEISKRVFQVGNAEITYKNVNDMVRKEALQRAQNEGYVNEEDFNRSYKNPIEENSFNELVAEMQAKKEYMVDRYNIKKFHSDIRVWDTGSFKEGDDFARNSQVAGEIDILAEHEDGSFTVIDMKTRRKGMDDYDGSHIRGFNTKTKHTMQTSLYSKFMKKMGFNMNDPMILMAKPVYSDIKVAENEKFEPIAGDELVAIIELKLNYDFFNYNVGKIDPLTGERGVDRQVRNKSLGNRRDYEVWYNDQMRTQGWILDEPFLQNREEYMIQIAEQFAAIENILEMYKKQIEDSGNGIVSPKLDEIKMLLGEQAKKELSKISALEQLSSAHDFFIFASNELKALAMDLDRPKASLEDKMKASLRIKNYKGVFAMAKELYTTLDNLKGSMDIPKEEFKRLEDVYNAYSILDRKLEDRVAVTNRTLAKQIFMDSYLGSKFEIEAIKKWEIAARNDATLEDNAAKQEYLNKMRSSDEFREEVEKKYEEELDKLFTENQYDIMNMTYQLNSDVMVNNDFVQLTHKMLLGGKRQFASTVNAEMVELDRQYQELNLSQKELDELVVEGADGYSYLQTHTKIEFFNKSKELQDKVNEARNKQGNTEQENVDNRAAVKAAEVIRNEWIKENTTEGKPIDKWSNTAMLKGLNERQRKALILFVTITENADKRTGGKRSLKVSKNGASYFRLPSIKETAFQSAARGGFMATLKRSWEAATTFEKDEEESYGPTSESTVNDANILVSNSGLDGKQVLETPLFFRNKLDDKPQSRDLFSVYAMEMQNGVRYKIDNRMSLNAQIIMDVVNNTTFYKTNSAGQRFMSKFSIKGSDNVETMQGDASNVSKMLDKMFKNRVYSMTQEFAGKILGKYDVQKTMQTLSSYTAFAAMSFKMLSATNNFMTGNIGIILEAVGGEIYDKEDIAKAHKTYLGNIPSIMGDIGQPVRSSFMNQLMVRLNVQGEISVLNNQFEKKNWATRNLTDVGNSMFLYSMGEHQIHATLMLSVLISQKVINKQGEWLTNEGKVTKNREEAANLLDSYSLDENGLLKQADWATYSEFDTQNAIDNKPNTDNVNADGETSIMALIKDRVTRTQGAYGEDTKSQLDRMWYGQLFKQFKKHIAPQMLNRWRGIGKFDVANKDIEEKDKFYNYASKTDEQGYYVTFIKHIWEMGKANKLNVMKYKNAHSDTWKTMSKHERANIIKATTELSYISTVALLSMLAAGAAGDGDEQVLWNVAALLRRQVGDAGAQYFNPAEMWRIADSPFAVVKTLGTITSLMGRLIWVPGWGEEYKSGVNAGNNRLAAELMKFTIGGVAHKQFTDNWAKQQHTYLSR